MSHENNQRKIDAINLAKKRTRKRAINALELYKGTQHIPPKFTDEFMRYQRQHSRYQQLKQTEESEGS